MYHISYSLYLHLSPSSVRRVSVVDSLTDWTSDDTARKTRRTRTYNCAFDSGVSVNCHQLGSSLRPHIRSMPTALGPPTNSPPLSIPGSSIPKQVPTPPPADDEPKYLAVRQPYPLNAHWGLSKDIIEFARWIACITDPFYTFSHKPTRVRRCLVRDIYARHSR